MPLPIVFGHHDLLCGNFIDDGNRLWLIDWEYGGFGTAMFDLANLAANGSFSPADDRLLLEAYFRQPVSDEVQRSFDAMKVASALREAVWAMVSAIHLDVPGADYAAHAADYLARTEAALARFAERHGNLARPDSPVVDTGGKSVEVCAPAHDTLIIPHASQLLPMYRSAGFPLRVRERGCPQTYASLTSAGYA